MDLSKKQKELFRKIADILWEEWDPIGVNDNENIRDEYQSYTPHVYRLVTGGADQIRIANHLYQLETVSMSMQGDEIRCKKVAQLLLALKEV